MEQLSSKVMAGNVRAASRLIRDIEDNLPQTRKAIKAIFPYTGRSHVVGITGSPGAGKSTLVDEMISAYRKKSKTIGVLAVDPTSPFTGGAILGDRIRMLRHAEDTGVFVRSLATRGAMGGLSRAVGDGIHVMDVMGKDKIIVETVGVGQQEVDIINHAHTIIVVQVPGMGDEIQAIKAGLMEIADIFVINKADRDGAGKLYREIQNMLDMGDFTDKWRPRILKIESIQDPHKFSDSVMELTETVDQHYQYLIEHNDLATRQKRKIVAELNDAMRATILDPIINHLHAHGVLEEMVNKLVQKETDPYSIAEEVARKYMDAEFNHQFAD